MSLNVDNDKTKSNQQSLISTSTSTKHEFTRASGNSEQQQQQKTNANPVPDARWNQYVDPKVSSDPQFQSLLEYLREDTRRSTTETAIQIHDLRAIDNTN